MTSKMWMGSLALALSLMAGSAFALPPGQVGGGVSNAPRQAAPLTVGQRASQRVLAVRQKAVAMITKQAHVQTVAEPDAHENTVVTSAKVAAPSRFAAWKKHGMFESGGFAGPLGAPTPDQQNSHPPMMESGGFAGPVGAPTPDQYHVVKGPTGKAFVRTFDGALYVSVVSAKPNELPPAVEPGTTVTPGFVSGPTGKQFFRDANGNLYEPLTQGVMKKAGLKLGDLPPVLRPTSGK